MRPLAILFAFTFPCSAQLTWSLASNNGTWPADKRAAIVSAMTEAAALYNANGYFPKALWINYDASVPTANGSYNGTINFGGMIGTRVALHEISHTLGVGTVTAWNNNRSGNTWTGTYAINRVKLFNGSSATLSADAAHFWPYGLNHDSEDGTTARVRHIKMVSALRRDMGIVKDSDNDGLPDDWEIFYFGNLNQTATGDADGDGVNNLDEYNADTNPAAATTQWTGTTSSDYTVASNWSPTPAPSNGTFYTRLNVNNAANHPLIYDATRGTTILRPADRGLVIGSGTGSGAMIITGGSFSTVGAASPDIIGNSGNTASLTIDGGSFASTELHLGVNGSGSGTLTLNSGSTTIGTLAFRFSTGSGTVNLNGGILTTGRITRSFAGTATLNLNSATIRASADEPAFLEGLSNAFIKSGGATIDTSTRTITIAQPLKNDPSSPGGGLTKSGTGILTLTGNNTYTGPTAINAGILIAENAAAISASASVASDATLALTNSTSYAAGESLTLSGTGQKSATTATPAVQRGALQSISGNNTWNGPVTIATTKTRIGVQDGASLTISGNITESAPATAVIFRAGQNPGDDITLNSPASWTGDTLVFSSNATGGALKLGASNVLPATSPLLLAGNSVQGRLDLNGHDQTVAGLSNDTGGSSAIGDGIITNTAATPSTLTLDLPASTTREFIGAIENGTGGIQLVKQGGGSQILSGNNTFNGATFIHAGLLTAASDTALGHANGPTTVASNAALRLAHGITITGETITLSGSGGNSAVGNFSGALQAAQNASATWAGPVILGDASARIGALPGGTLEISGPISGSDSSQSLTIGAGTGGTATVILSAPAGSSTYTGPTAIIRGTLKLGAPNTLPATTILDIDSANAAEDAILDLNGHPQTAAGLQRTNTSGGAGASILTNSHANPAVLTLAQDSTSTFSGRITGSLSLVKSGSGTLSLTSTTNAYSGNTSVTAGTLALSSAFLANSSAVSIASGAQLALNFPGANTITALFINGLRMPTGTYSAANSSGRIAGTGTLIVTSAGTAGYAPWIDSFPNLTTDQKLPTADPDGDGVNNITEFALDGNPASGASTGKVVGKIASVGGSPTLIISLPVRTGATFSGATEQVSNLIDGVTYKIQGSDELTTWNLVVSEVLGGDKTAIESTLPAVNPGWTRRTFQSPGAITGDPKKFLRAVIIVAP